MGAYEVLWLLRSAEESWKPFENEEFVDFRDSMKGPCTYNCTILHCLKGLEFAQKFGWYDMKTFDVSEYQQYESIEHGDLNWIIPKKLMAFSTPIESTKKLDGIYYGPEFYIPIFKKLGVTAVVRLTTEEYDREVQKL